MPKKKSKPTTQDALIGFMVIDLTSLVDIEMMASVYVQQIERNDFVRSVAAGEPASAVHGRLRHKRVTGP